ncbi:MAG: hypothetical protein JOY82_01565 [Streptosporangiaceae bacterium]|nr:hypothetical protein [Streptosporangiaceae bacterium]MBV9853200.1 hypothetical protein [Streptosporangiaceae bacterium]
MQGGGHAKWVDIIYQELKGSRAYLPKWLPARRVLTIVSRDRDALVPGGHLDVAPPDPHLGQPGINRPYRTK